MNRLPIWLAAAVIGFSSAFAAQYSVKFDNPTHSVFHGGKFNAVTTRDFRFNLSDGAFQTGKPTGGYVDYSEATNSPAPLNGVIGGYDTPIAWPTNKVSQSYIYQTCPPRDPDGDPHNEMAYAFPLPWLFNSQLCISQSSDIEADFHDRVAAFGTDGINYTFAPTDISVHFRGGPFEGTKSKVKGMIATGLTGSHFNGMYDDNWSAVGDVFIQVDWGIDPWGGHEYYLFQLSMSAVSGTSDMDCIPLASAYSQMLGADPESYLRGIQQDLQSQLASGAAWIDGPPPELLFLYDFSGQFTVPPLTTIPQQALVLSEFDGYTNFPGFVNQYDAGVAFNLPVRFPKPNPVVDGCTPGGNACGPTSLMMAMNAFVNGSVTDAKPVFKNSTSAGLHYGTCNDKNGFDAGKAQSWLMGSNMWKTQHLDVPPFTAVTGMLYSDTLQNSSSIDKGWTMIDQMLTGKKQPVVFRSDLSVGVTPGGGHMILLVGKGHSDTIGEAWGQAFGKTLSGDYYIVADPAGHYFSDPSHTHYDLVDNLREQGKGVAYGGWFGVYPVELLRTRTFDKFTQIINDSTGNPIQTNTIPGNRLTALAIGETFGRRLLLEVHSPVALMVTDSAGRRTGVQPDGAYVDEIPSSVFMPDLTFEEGEGTTEIDPDGPQSVFIEEPAAGAYQVNLVGTGVGEFTFDWHELAADGTEIAGGVYSGTTTVGEVHSYTVQVGATNSTSPRVQAAPSGGALVISWPASFTGFSIESSADPSSNWQPYATTITIQGDHNSATIPLAQSYQFFRLKH